MKVGHWAAIGTSSVAVNGLLLFGLATAMGGADVAEEEIGPDRVRVVARPPPPPPPDPNPPAADAPSSAAAPPASLAPPVEPSPVQGTLEGLPIPKTQRELFAEWQGAGKLPSFVASGASARSAGKVLEVQEAQLLFQPNLERYYPRRARDGGIEGHTDVLLSVSARGKVEDVQILDSQPPGVFEGAARAAARQLRLQPAKRNGRPQPSKKALRLTWTLPDRD